MSNLARKVPFASQPKVNDRRRRARSAPGFSSCKGRKVVDGLTKAELVRKYEHSVRAIALHIASKVSTMVDADDLISVGFIGLMDAADKYDASRGVNFLSYAELRIRGAILDELRKHDFVPKSARRQVKLLESANDKIERKTGQRATPEQLGAEMGVTTERARSLRREYANLSLVHYEDPAVMERDQAQAQAGNTSGASHSAFGPDPFEATQQTFTREWLEQLLGKLPAPSRTVIACYYFRELQMKDIASILEVSEARVSQLHSEAILKLKQLLAGTSCDLKSLFSSLLAA